MTAQFRVGPRAPFGRASTSPIRKRVEKFLELEEKALKAAAVTAQRTSRAGFQYKRPFAPPRAGRSSTGGKMTSFIRWRPESATGSVELDVAALNKAAKHWIIQEIGTGKSATMRAGNAGDKKGHAVRTVSVRRQRGRHISSALVWAASGQPVPPGMARGQQLFLRADLPGGGAPLAMRGMTIRREIEGQHFIREGASAGFRQYEELVLAAARTTFRKGAVL